MEQLLNIPILLILAGEFGRQHYVFGQERTFRVYQSGNFEETDDMSAQ